MQSFERTFVQIVLATITAVTVANLVVNYRGTVQLAQVAAGFPINLANALRAGSNR
jgi:hypothetical protein